MPSHSFYPKVMAYGKCQHERWPAGSLVSSHPSFKSISRYAKTSLFGALADIPEDKYSILTSANGL